MDAYLVWLLVGLALVIVELLTGTFYLLVLGVAAFGAGAVPPGSAVGFAVQAIVRRGGVAAAARYCVHAYRARNAAQQMASIDAGQPANFESWVDQARGPRARALPRRELGRAPRGGRGAAAGRAALRARDRRQHAQGHVQAPRLRRSPRTGGVPCSSRLIVSLVLAGVTFALTRTPAYAVYVFLLAAVVAFVLEGVRVVPQQSAFVVERFGRFHATLEPGLNFIVPVFDRVAYRHSLKEVPLDVPEQVCITKDNTQLGVDGILYYQVTDPRLASYGSSNYIAAISQLAQTTLRSEIGKMELDKTFESRDEINQQIVAVAGRGGAQLGHQGAALRDQEPDARPRRSCARCSSRSPPSARSAR